MKKENFLKRLLSAALPEAVELVTSLLPGPLGMAIPAIGNVILNFKKDKELDERLEEIEESIEELKLNSEQQESMLKEIKRIGSAYIENNMDESIGFRDIYTVDYLNVVLRSGEFIGQCFDGLTEAQNDGSSQIYCYTDNIFIVGNTIVITLLEYQNKEELTEMVSEMEEIIKECCDMKWGKCPIKEIQYC